MKVFPSHFFLQYNNGHGLFIQNVNKKLKNKIKTF